MEPFWSILRPASRSISCPIAKLQPSCPGWRSTKKLTWSAGIDKVAYADAVKRALPHATQVADRYHLIHNLREHVQRFLDRKRTCLPEIEDSPLKAVSTDDPGLASALETQTRVRTSQPSPSTAAASSTDQPQVQVQPDLGHGQMGEERELASLTYAERKKKISRDKRYARYEQVRALHQAGMG